MRIISGKLGGRQFDSPHGHKTHPMSEKMRGAIFNMLGDITGLTVLDAFSGSGALAFEAISRGAASAVTIEQDIGAYQTILNNVVQLSIDNIKVIRANASGWSDNNPNLQFDILLLDPPYDDLQPKLLQKLTLHAKPQGLIVLSCPKDADTMEQINVQMITHKQYGDSRLVFYRKN